MRWDQNPSMMQYFPGCWLHNRWPGSLDGSCLSRDHKNDRVQPVPNVASQWQPWLWPWGGRPNPRGILAPPHCKLNMIMPCADQWSPSLFLIQYLQLVYEFFLRFLESPDFQPSIGLNIYCRDDPYLFQEKKWSIKSLSSSYWSFLILRTQGE